MIINENISRDAVLQKLGGPFVVTFATIGHDFTVEFFFVSNLYRLQYLKIENEKF